MLKMKYNLPTKEECDAICEKTDAFYKAERVIEGQNVVLYDYRLASISDFVDNDAFELRGICFVQNEDSTWERNILLNKFFNVGQTSIDDLWEVDLGGDKPLRVSETHNFHLTNGDTKFARDLTENDDIVGWDELTELQ
jgi:hypothetical protein